MITNKQRYLDGLYTALTGKQNTYYRYIHPLFLVIYIKQLSSFYATRRALMRLYIITYNLNLSTKLQSIVRHFIAVVNKQR
jgi:hypothetical protein